ncbi:MAG: hypothetical protein QM817_01140 [Archangium sp.]
MKRRVAASAMLGLFVLVWLGVRAQLVSSTVWAVNGLGFPIEVEVNGTRLRVEPDQAVNFGNYRRGTTEFVTRSIDGRELERRAQQVTERNTIYNPFGAAPVAAVHTTYVSSSSSLASEPATLALYCGTLFVGTRSEDVFIQSPSNVSVSSLGRAVTRESITVLAGGFRRCVRELEWQRAADLLLELAGVFDGDEARSLKWLAARLLAGGGNRLRARQVAESIMGGSPGFDDHRSYQSVAKSLGDTTPLIARYRERYEADRTSANLFLYARLLPAAEAWPLVEQLESDEEPLHRVRLWAAVNLKRFEDVVAEARWCLANGTGRDFCAEQGARALVSLGKAEDALRLLESRVGSEPIDTELAINLSRTADVAGKKPEFDPLSRLARAATEQRLVTLLKGDPSPAAAFDDPFGIVVLAQTDPGATLTKLERDPGLSLLFSRELTALLTAEALRNHKVGLASRLGGFLAFGVSLQTLQRWILYGEGDLALDDLDQNVRAAVWLARARQLEALGEDREAQAAYREVGKTDVLHGLAFRALSKWPPPPQTKLDEGTLDRVE